MNYPLYVRNDSGDTHLEFTPRKETMELQVTRLGLPGHERSYTSDELIDRGYSIEWDDFSESRSVSYSVAVERRRSRRLYRVIPTLLRYSPRFVLRMFKLGMHEVTITKEQYDSLTHVRVYNG